MYGEEMIDYRVKTHSAYMRYGGRVVSRETGATIENQEIENAICSVYGEIVTDDEENGQMTLADVSDMGIFDLGRPELHTTGCDRTGCMFCGYGCHLEKSPSRFERMKITHPKQYEYIMRPWEEEVTIMDAETGELTTATITGLNYKEIIDWINEHGNLNIRY
jgi:hypothetical protein